MPNIPNIPKVSKIQFPNILKHIQMSYGISQLGGEQCKVFEKSKYFDSESVTSLITSLKAISRNLVLLIAKQYLEKDSIFSNI